MRSLRTRAGAAALALGLAGCGSAGPRLLLLVTVDTLRADVVGAYGDPRGLTPHLDALAREGLVFTAAWAPAAFTLPSIASILTGRYPEELGIRSNESGLPASVATLAGSLSERGWRTRAVVGNFVLRAPSGVARGFEHFDDAFPQEEVVRGTPERDAASTTDAALVMLEECLDRAAERCFLWVHYQDPHGPYDPPAELRAALLDVDRGEPDAGRHLPVGTDQRGVGSIPAYQFVHGRHDVGFYRAGYRAEVQYMDRELGRLLASLEGSGVRDRAVVVFAADHGESLGEHDIWFAHGERLGDEQVRVPLVLRVPGRAAGRRDDPVSLVDLFPTLLGLAGGPPPPVGLPGRDLLGPRAEQGHSTPYMATLGAGSVARWALVSEGFKLEVAAEADGPRTRLTRLGSEAVDLSGAAPEQRERLLATLRSLREGLVQAPETPQTLSEADRARLRALGYGTSESMTLQESGMRPTF